MIVHKSKKLKNQQEWGRRQGHTILKLKANKNKPKYTRFHIKNITTPRVRRLKGS